MRRRGGFASAAEIILIGYAADADLAAVATMLSAAGVPNLLWLYDAHAEDLSVDAAPGAFRLQRGDEILSSDDFASARIVVHRTGLGRWRTPVAATNTAGAERAFIEREWASLLQGLFLEVEQLQPHLTWLNPPSVSAVTSGKYALLSSAHLDGLAVPDLRVSTEGHLPVSASGQYVCKAISEDESIDDATTYATAVLDTETLDALPFRTNCPSLIQVRVRADYEVRVYYLLGEVIGVHIRAESRDYADIRLLPPRQRSAEVAPIAPPMHAALRGYCERRHLSYCVFDFLRAADGRDLLIDVTPSGTWSHLEPPADRVITSWYEGILTRIVREANFQR